MANSLGQLMVKLGLDAAEFTSGLTKAEYQAQRVAQSIGKDIGGAVKTVAGLLGGLAIGSALYESAKAIIAEAEALNDLADSTGSSVEQLSALRNQAYVAGADIGTLTGALNKLAAGMSGSDEETTKAKEALKALGISTRDPAQAFQEIAAKLATYEDGVNKAGIAVALFGKQGVALLPTLKDIAELQDIGATTTKQQTDAAENLGKEYRRLTVEATAFKDILLSGVVPALADTLKAFRLAQGMGAGFFQSLDFAMRGKGEIADNISTIEKNVASLQARLEAYKATTSSSKPAFASTVEAMTAEIDQAKRALATLKAIQGPKELDFGPPVLKGEAPSGFGADDKKGAARAKAKVDEAEQYIKSLQGQLEKTYDLTVAEQVLREVQVGRLKDATKGQIETALAIAQEIDASKEAKRIEDERKKAADDALKSQKAIADATSRAIQEEQRSAEAMQQGNEQLREQIIALKGGQEALDAYTIAKLQSAAATLEDKANTYEWLEANEEMVKAIRAQAAALRERAGLIGETGLAEKTKREVEYLQELGGTAFDLVGRSVNDIAVYGAKASDVVKRLGADLLTLVNSEALRKIKDLALGTNSGPNIFDLIGKFAGFAFGAASGGGGVPGVGFSGGGFGEHFALGGVSSGGWATVGENGPELVNLEKGARVYSNADSRGMMGGTTVNNHFSIQGPVNRATEYQVAQAAQRGLARAGRR